MLLKDVQAIKNEIKVLETRIEELTQKITLFQLNCTHIYIRNGPIQECRKCMHIVNLNW